MWVEAEREGTKMVRDSQKWKKVEIIRPRSYAQAVSQQDRSTYQEDPDVGAGVTQGTVQQGAVRADQQEEGDGGQDQREVGQDPQQGGAGIYQDRPDIRARHRRHPDIIVADTPANRPTRVRRPPREVYQPEPRPATKRGRKRK